MFHISSIQLVGGEQKCLEAAQSSRPSPAPPVELSVIFGPFLAPRLAQSAAALGFAATVGCGDMFRELSSDQETLKQSPWGGGGWVGDV